jgi:hypothetical protein
MVAVENTADTHNVIVLQAVFLRHQRQDLVHLRTSSARQVSRPIWCLGFYFAVQWM